MAEFPALPLWTDSYLGDTTHLTTIQHGAYLLLLVCAWRSKTCSLPDDDKLLARYARMTLAQWLRVKPVIEPFWRVADGEWSNGRLRDELEAVRRNVKQRSDAGKSSALKRLHRGSTAVERNLNGEATPIPTPITTPLGEVKKSTFLMQMNGVGKKLGSSNGTTTIKDPIQRLARFQQKLIPLLGAEAWTIIDLSMRPSHPEYLRCLDLCKAAAKKIDKGWPTNWPTVETENASAKEIH